jgi:hypothetical protein
MPPTAPRPVLTLPPKRPTDPATCRWKLIAKVDTTKQYELAGGQYGVSISDDSGSLGQYQYFLFDVFKTSDDQDGHTFYSEIDVRAVTPAGTEKSAGPDPVVRPQIFTWDLDYSQSPDLKDWAETKLRPAVEKWYPVWVDYTGRTAEDLWKEDAASLPAGNPGGNRRGWREGAAGVTNAPAGVTNTVPVTTPAGG